MCIFREYYKSMMRLYNSLGYSYSYLKTYFMDFIEYCETNHPENKTITKECAIEWIYLKESKSRKVLGDKVNTIRHFSEYLNSIGIESYMPNIYVGKDYHKPISLFNDRQLSVFFSHCDSIKPYRKSKNREYIIPVLFRLIYACGLRNSEATNIKLDDIDLDNGRIRIIHSKGDKDRIVFMDESVIDLCRRFNTVQNRFYPNREYFFHCCNSNGHLSKYNVDDYFDKVLEESGLKNEFIIKPTVHGLRHLFAVNNLRKCLDLKQNMDVYIKYLSQYMGHENVKETMYYIHMFETLLPAFKEKVASLTKGLEVVFEEF